LSTVCSGYRHVAAVSVNALERRSRRFDASEIDAFTEEWIERRFDGALIEHRVAFDAVLPDIELLVSARVGGIHGTGSDQRKHGA